MAVDEVSVDQNLLAGTFVGVKRQWFKQAFHYCVQASCANIFGALVDLPCQFSDALDATWRELQTHVFASRFIIRKLESVNVCELQSCSIELIRNDLLTSLCSEM